MTKENVKLFLAINKQCILNDKKSYQDIENALMKLDEEQEEKINDIGFLDPSFMFVITVLFGTFGVDRFILKDPGMGVVKLLTFGLFGILYVLDAVKIIEKVRIRNTALLLQELENIMAE